MCEGDGLSLRTKQNVSSGQTDQCSEFTQGPRRGSPKTGLTSRGTKTYHTFSTLLCEYERLEDACDALTCENIEI